MFECGAQLRQDGSVTAEIHSTAHNANQCVYEILGKAIVFRAGASTCVGLANNGEAWCFMSDVGFVVIRQKTCSIGVLLVSPVFPNNAFNGLNGHLLLLLAG